MIPGESVPLLPASLIEPLWVEFAALIESDRPEFDPTHPWGCHRRRIPDRVVFDHVIAALVHGSGYERIASPGCWRPHHPPPIDRVGCTRPAVAAARARRVWPDDGPGAGRAG